MICNFWGAAVVLRSLSFIVCVLFDSNPANLTTGGLAEKIPWLPTASDITFDVFGLVVNFIIDSNLDLTPTVLFSYFLLSELMLDFLSESITEAEPWRLSVRVRLDFDLSLSYNFEK